MKDPFKEETDKRFLEELDAVIKRYASGRLRQEVEEDLRPYVNKPLNGDIDKPKRRQKIARWWNANIACRRFLHIIAGTLICFACVAALLNVPVTPLSGLNIIIAMLFVNIPLVGLPAAYAWTPPVSTFVPKVWKKIYLCWYVLCSVCDVIVLLYTVAAKPDELPLLVATGTFLFTAFASPAAAYLFTKMGIFPETDTPFPW